MPGRRRRLQVGVALAAAAAWTVVPSAQSSEWRRYADPQNRFTFEYPLRYGDPSRGSDDGFQERAASVRFVRMTSEAVLTRGPVLVDHQAVGGLYDHFVLQAVPAPDRAAIEKARSPLTVNTFCTLLGSSDRVAALQLPPRLVPAAQSMDRMGAADPHVHTCRVEGRIVTFNREASRRFVFGAIRFLEGQYSSFQLVASASVSPLASELDDMTRVARSLTGSGIQ
jgi:hypothetical protein